MILFSVAEVDIYCFPQLSQFASNTVLCSGGCLGGRVDQRGWLNEQVFRQTFSRRENFCVTRAVGILQELIKAHTNKTEVRHLSQSLDQIRKKGVDGEEKVRKRRKRTTIWRDLVEMEKDATLQDIR